MKRTAILFVLLTVGCGPTEEEIRRTVRDCTPTPWHRVSDGKRQHVQQKYVCAGGLEKWLPVDEWKAAP